MIDSIGQEIIVGIILAVGSKIASNFWNAFKLQVQNDKIKTRNNKSKRLIKTQFYAYLPVGIICLIAAPVIQNKLFQFYAWMFAFIGFLGAWGAFDESIANWENKINDSDNKDSDDKTN